MSFGRFRKSGRRRAEEGFSLLEVLIAAFLLLIVFYGVTQYYVRGRTQIDYEENRRRATAIAQDRLDGIRRDYRYDHLITRARPWPDTTFVIVDSGASRSYRVSHEVTPGAPEPEATTLTVTVNWSEKVAGVDVPRSLQTTTMLARGMP